MNCTCFRRHIIKLIIMSWTATNHRATAENSTRQLMDVNCIGRGRVRFSAHTFTSVKQRYLIRQEDRWACCLIGPPLMMSAGEWDDFRAQIASMWSSRSWRRGDDRDGLIIGVLGWVILAKRGAEWPHIAWWGFLLLGCYISISWDLVPAVKAWPVHDSGWITVLARAVSLLHKRLPLNVVKQGKGQEVKKWTKEGRREESKAVCDRLFVLSALH